MSQMKNSYSDVIVEMDIKFGSNLNVNEDAFANENGIGIISQYLNSKFC